MYQIARIEVDGFWETHHLKVDLFTDVTFFIGTNGTGKTTFINLLAAALTGDFATLERIPFRRIAIHLRSTEGTKGPTILLNKIQKKDRQIEIVEYRIKKIDQAEIRFSVDEIDEITFRDREIPLRFRRDLYHRRFRGVLTTLNELVQVQWLSVHRATIPSSRDERTYESAVDRKLEALSHDLVRYFGPLQKQKDEKVRQFQEYIFFSLLEQPDANTPFDERYHEGLDNYEETIAEIFRELHVKDAGIDSLISSFFTRASAANEAFKKKQRFTTSDFAILIALRKIKGVVDKWRTLQKQLSEIFAQRDQFIDITNELLQRKRVEINDSNEITFVTRTNKNLTPQMLSSGEKQLLILLSEVLLQRQTPAIFIADEPELSLHVSWQEKLVPSLRRLNPQAQIIAATHSPDIVGPLSSRAIDMETIIP